MMDYNEERPHDSLGKLPPAMYRQKLENSSLELLGFNRSVQHII
jgi:putative transposase